MGTDPDATRRVDPDDYVTRAGFAVGAQVFNRYRLEVPAGRGGMGIVWRAHDGKLDRLVALKFLPAEVAADAEAVRDLKRETKRCLELTHPHIVRVYDFVEAEGLAAIAMEFVEGESLAKRKAEAPGGCLAVAELAPLVAQLCGALDYAHREARVVHRDLKPANLLVTPDGKVKITDFGIARSLTETQTRLTGRTTGTSGTLLYMSPQQLLGKKATAGDDIYALGVTLYELLTGKPPFYTGDITHQILQETPASLAAHRAELEVTGPPIPRAWEDTILACLAKELQDRPRSAGEVAARMGLAVAPVEGVAEGSRERRRVEAPRSTRRWVIGAVAAAIVLGVAGFLLWPRGPRSPLPASGPAEQPPAAEQPPVKPAEPAVAYAATGGREFVVTVEPAEAAARLWIGPLSDVEVRKGRAVLKNLPDGQQDLVVQAPGYEPSTTHVTVAEGRGSAEVRLVTMKGTLTVAARPGTEVTAVDERGRETRLGAVPAGGVLDVGGLLTMGRYALRLENPDCAPATVPDVNLTVGRTAKVAPVQTPLPGELRVFSVPTGAEVRVNRQVVGQTPATLRGQPSEQPLRLEVFLRGYLRVEQEVTLQPKEVRTVNVGTLVAENGRLELRFPNAGAPAADVTVRIDGRRTVGQPGARGAMLIDELESGSRAVEVTHPDYEVWRQPVTIRDQQTTTVEVALAPKPGRLRLNVKGPAEASLFLNDQPVAAERWRDGVVQLPAMQPLNLEVRAPGWRSAQRTLTLPPNGTDSWQVTLENQTHPMADQSWTNTLGMRFVPVPGTGALFSVWVTRVQDYDAFMRAANRSWPKPDFEQGPTHPAVNVSWDDAQAFCRWLTGKERSEGRLTAGQAYRLPTDAEWSVAVGLGPESGSTAQEKNGKIRDVYPWGRQSRPPTGAGNYADGAAKRKYPARKVFSGYEDGHADTSPVGSFTANQFGLYDMGGNVWQWCQDFGRDSSGKRVLRGGSFGSGTSDLLLSSRRFLFPSDVRYDDVGFRCVVTGAGGSSL